MNQVKLTIRNEAYPHSLATFGTSVEAKTEYTNTELIGVLKEMITELNDMEELHRRAKWEQAEAKRKRDLRDKELAHASKVEELKKAGWEFDVQELWHPHTAAKWCDPVFKSPRMKSFASYTSGTDFIQAEAESCATVAAALNIKKLHELFKNALIKEYIKDNSIKGDSEFRVNLNVTF